MCFVCVFDSFDTVYSGCFVFPVLEILCVYRRILFYLKRLSEIQAKKVTCFDDSRY